MPLLSSSPSGRRRNTGIWVPAAFMGLNDHYLLNLKKVELREIFHEIKGHPG